MLMFSQGDGRRDGCWGTGGMRDGGEQERCRLVMLVFGFPPPIRLPLWCDVIEPCVTPPVSFDSSPVLLLGMNY